MLRFFGFLLIFMNLWIPPSMVSQISDKPQVDSPKQGEIIQGLVSITGNTEIVGFQSCEVLFAYAVDNTDTWFLIQQSNEMVKDGTIATWDTTTITDGNYRLMVRVYLDDNSTTETIITGLRVRNYTSAETSTPAPTSIAEGVGEAQSNVTPETVQIPQDLHSNPALISSKEMFVSILKGMAFSAIALVIIGGFIFIRSLIRRK